MVLLGMIIANFEDKTWVTPAAAGMAIIGGIVSLMVAVRVATADEVAKAQVNQLAVIVALWAVLPPAWFWFEFYHVNDFRNSAGNTRNLEFEELKHGAHLAGAVWIGLLAVLAGTLSSASDQLRKSNGEVVDQTRTTESPKTEPTVNSAEAQHTRRS